MSELQLHQRSLGQGPPLLLLHGLFGSGDNLSALARACAARHEVLLPDLRNHGRSPWSDTMDIAAMADDVLRLLDARGLGRIALLGHSLGGKVAMQLALANPHRVRALVVADIAPVDYPRHHDRILDALSSLPLATVRSRNAADAWLAQHGVAEEGVRQFLLKSLYRDAGGFHWRFNLAALRDGYDELRRAPTAQGPYAGPVLWLKGEHSDYIRPEHEAPMRERFPRFRFRMLAGTGHWLHAEKPIAFQRLVCNFLAESGAEADTG